MKIKKAFDSYAWILNQIVDPRIGLETNRVER